MRVEQFVMAYEAEQDRIRAMLPEGFVSLRPVLRINAEIKEGETGWIEFNTPVEKDGVRGWVNIGCWENASFERSGRKVIFRTDLLEISFEGVGIEGRCPAEKDNAGCWFGNADFRPAETITSNKEYCDCSFRWLMEDGAEGKSTGQTLPAYPTEIKTVYPREDFTVENAAKIPCRQVLGTYMVNFKREEKMMKVYGADICIDCRNFKAIQRNRGFQVEYVNIIESTMTLKEFLEIRDMDPLYAEIREEHTIGIPLFVREDGLKTFDWDEALAWIGQPPVQEEEIAER